VLSLSSTAGCHVDITEAQSAGPKTKSLQPMHDEWVVIESSGIIEDRRQLGMIFLRRTLKPSADHLIPWLVVAPPRPFEVEHGGMAFAEHRPRLPARGSEIQAPGQFVTFVSKRSTAVVRSPTTRTMAASATAYRDPPCRDRS
jgi:hypothetical protein